MAKGKLILGALIAVSTLVSANNAAVADDAKVCKIISALNGIPDPHTDLEKGVVAKCRAGDILMIVGEGDKRLTFAPFVCDFSKSILYSPQGMISCFYTGNVLSWRE